MIAALRDNRIKIDPIYQKNITNSFITCQTRKYPQNNACYPHGLIKMQKNHNRPLTQKDNS